MSSVCLTLVVDAVLFIEGAELLVGFLLIASIVLAFAAVFVAHLNVLLGARRMMTLRSYRLAPTSAGLSMIPILTPAYLVAIPFGIWAFVRLKRRNVRDAFSTVTT